MISLDARKQRELIVRKLDNMIRLDSSRYDFHDRSQKMIAAYCNCGMSNAQFFAKLVGLPKELNEEEQRHVRVQSPGG